MTVPPRWAGGLILARVTNETVVNCGIGPGGCYVRVTVDGIEAEPAIPAEWIDGGLPQFVDRSLAVGPGTHTVQAQVLTPADGAAMELYDWGFTVELASTRG